MKTIGIELGTCFTKVYVKNEGVFFNEATAIAYLKNNRRIIAIGTQAEKMIGKAPIDIEAINPIEEGVIKNFNAATLLLEHLINKALGVVKFLKPEIILSIPVVLSSVELKGFMELFDEIKVKKVYIIKEPILALIGAKINLNEPRSHLVIHFGGGKCDIGIISLGGLVAQELVRFGADDVTRGIKEYIEESYDITISTSIAERVRNHLLNLVINKKVEDETMEVRGTDTLRNISKSIIIKSAEIRNVVTPYIDEIIQGVKKVLRDAPSESVADFLDNGCYLTGGGAHLKNLDRYIFDEIGIKPIIPEKPELCVLNGLKFASEHLDFYKETLRLS